MNWHNRLINPVLEKEFRLRMRTFRAPLTVFFYLLVVSLFALGYLHLRIVVSGVGMIRTNDSQEFFYFISGVQMVLIAFMAPGLTAGVISGEREKQTLNILLTTRQSSATIILSKLIASLGFMTLLVVATAPIYSIVFLYGGVSPWQFVSTFLFYLFTMLVIGSVGVFFSTLLKRTMVSVIITYGVVLAMFGFTAMLAVFLELTLQRGPVPGLVLSLNPMAALFDLFEPELSRQALWRGSNIHMWHLNVGFYTVLAGLLLWVAIRKLRPSAGRR